MYMCTYVCMLVLSLREGEPKQSRGAISAAKLVLGVGLFRYDTKTGLMSLLHLCMYTYTYVHMYTYAPTHVCTCVSS